MDRAELAGTGAALAFHVALVAALSLHLAQVDTPPEPPSMEVELVDDIGLTAAAPQALAPPPSEAPEIGEAEPIEPTPAPAIAPPPPTPAIVPTPAPRPEPAAKPALAKRVPPKAAPTKPAPAKAPPAKAPARAAPRASRIGDDFLKGIADDAPASRAPAKATAATFNAAAKADVASAIAAQIRPCALRQRALGEGANRIRVVLNIRLTLAGRLKGAPTVVRTSGVDEENSQYEELVKDQAIASYRECAPLRLPAELYQTAQGGWSNINMNYKVP
jgi:outer membrane biosynthesis protein TonB